MNADFRVILIRAERVPAFGKILNHGSTRIAAMRRHGFQGNLIRRRMSRRSVCAKRIRGIRGSILAMPDDTQAFGLVLNICVYLRFPFTSAKSPPRFRREGFLFDLGRW